VLAAGLPSASVSANMLITFLLIKPRVSQEPVGVMMATLLTDISRPFNTMQITVLKYSGPALQRLPAYAYLPLTRDGYPFITETVFCILLLLLLVLLLLLQLQCWWLW
jgi:hypothetical protein